jgi:hypothetical protein
MLINCIMTVDIVEKNLLINYRKIVWFLTKQINFQFLNQISYFEFCTSFLLVCRYSWFLLNWCGPVFYLSLVFQSLVVTLDKSNMFGRCSCKLYKSYGILCRHIIQALRIEKQNKIPLIYIMKRWEKRCTRYMSICYAI